MKKFVIDNKFTFLVFGLTTGAFVGSQTLIGEPPSSYETYVAFVNNILIALAFISVSMYWIGHFLKCGNEK